MALRNLVLVLGLCMPMALVPQKQTALVPQQPPSNGLSAWRLPYFTNCSLLAPSEREFKCGGPEPSRRPSDALATGVRVAIPLVAILFMTQVALAFISRAAPAMQIFSIGFAVTMATGGFVLVLVLPDLGFELLAEVAKSGGKIESLLGAVQSAR